MKGIILSFLFSVSLYSAEWIAVPVVNVHDGDTFTTLIDGKRETIRVAYIDAPELEQKYGKESLCLAKSLLGDNVSIYEKGKDRYGRKICIVSLKHNNKEYDFSFTMISRGMAWFYPIGEKDQNWDSYRLEEYKAKENKLGIWIENPINPSEWRKNKNLIIKDSTGKELESLIKKMNPDFDISITIKKVNKSEQAIIPVPIFSDGIMPFLKQ